MKKPRQFLSRRSMLWNTVTAWIGGTAVSASAEYQHSATAVPDHSGADDIKDFRSVVRSDIIRPLDSYKDDLGRMFAGELRLAPGRYRINDILDIAPAAGLAGMTISGTGAATEIIFDGRAATILCSSSRGITFRDLTLRSMQGVDADQTAFTIDQHGNPLRSWRFERCDFIAFYQCFAVTGSALCSEFYFDKCQFLQCYRLMNNYNEQAVNWNFTNCNWENGEIKTHKEKNLSSIFFLTKGTFTNWVGGSMVFKGRIVLFNLTKTGSVQRPSHLVAFDGVRIELDGGEDPAPFVDRIDAGYASGTNQPTVAFTNCTILQRGSVSNPVYARVWANCSISFTNCKAKGGRVIGILDPVSPLQNGSIRIESSYGIFYEEDITDRLNTHDQHNVRIIADGSAANDQPIIDQRPCNLRIPVTMHPKYMYVRSSTGSLPLGGTVVHLAPVPDHTMIMRLFVRRFQTSLHRLVVELRDTENRTTYGTAILATGENRFAEGDIGLEMGFQIPTGTSLMLKFTGTPEIIKGIVGIEYL